MQEEDIIPTCVLAFMVLNYSNFLFTLLVAPPIFLIPFYLQVIRQAKVEFNPATGDPLSDIDQGRLVTTKMTNQFMNVSFMILHHYLYNKDLI